MKKSKNLQIYIIILSLAGFCHQYYYHGQDCIWVVFHQNILWI